MPDTPPEQGADRRQATALFADISGFTTMSEKMDPEEVRDVINRCFAMLEAVVDRHGGHVDKYIGDCIMAMFGVPKALESAPRQAVNAAIEMRNRLVDLNRGEEIRTPLGIHIGINSGLVLAGLVGGSVKRDFSVVGDSVNLASRLKDASPEGSIYVGPETYRYTSADFEYRRLGPQKIKGKELPVAVYEVQSVKKQVHRQKPTRTEGMISSEIVGRARELKMLGNSIDRLARGEGGIVNLTGEAGIGKSRLLAEVGNLAVAKDITLLEGRSLSIGQSLSFHPFVDLLQQWAGIKDEDEERQALEKLGKAIDAALGEHAGDCLPFVATLMGLRLTGEHAKRCEGIDGETLEKLILKSVRDLVERMAARRPLLLIFEDVHWADQSSIKLLEALLRLATTAPVLFLHALRPHHGHSSARILEVTRRHHPMHLTEIQLNPLDANECDLLIRNLLKIEDLPYTTRVLVARKAEGNPFYIEEVIRSLVDQGAIENKHGRFRVTAKIDSVVIPGTVQEVIMTRVDRLPQHPRQLLQIGAVIGRSFQHRILEALWTQQEDLKLALAYLKRSQLLEERHAGGEIQYIFKHALAQETVYDSILQKTRKELHIEVARSIESLFARRLSDFYGMLAYHYSRGEDLERAEEYLFKAGDEAARSAAASEALSYFQEASRLFLLIHGKHGDLGKKAMLEKNIGLALLNTGKLTEAIEHFEAALEHLGERVSRTTFARWAWFGVDMTALLCYLYLPPRLRGHSREHENDREALQIRYNRARAQLTTDPRRYFVDTVGSLRRLGKTDAAAIDQACGMYAGGAALFAYSGLPFPIGKRFLDVAAGLVRESNIRDDFVLRSMRFVHEYLKGNWEDDVAIDPELVDQALRYGQIFDVFVYLSLNAERKAYRGEFDGARLEIERLAQLSDIYGFEHARSSEYAMRAIMQVEQRRFEPAMDTLALYYANQHEEFFHLFALGTKAKIQTLRGDRAAAAETLAAAADLVRRLGQVFSVYHFNVYALSRFLYDVSSLEGDDDAVAVSRRALTRRAKKSARAALGIAGKVASARPPVYRLAGDLSWLLGKQDRALGWWTRSIEAGERLGARPELAHTHRDVGLRLSQRGGGTLRGMDAAQHLETARRLFEELEITWDRSRVASAGTRATVNGAA